MAAQIPVIVSSIQPIGRRKTCLPFKGVFPKLITMFLLLVHWLQFSYITPICQLSSICLSRPTAYSSSSALCLGKLHGPHQWKIVIPGFYDSSSDNSAFSRRSEIRNIDEWGQGIYFSGSLPPRLHWAGFVSQLRVTWKIGSLYNDWFYLPFSFCRLW